MSVPLPIEVVLVEDDGALLEATTQALALEGMQVQAFGDAAAALRSVSREFAGVIVSDVRMPGMDGLEFFARLRGLDPDLPVILTTAHGDVSMAVEAMKEGAADFLTKPYSSVALVRAIRASAGNRILVLENRRLRDELGRRWERSIPGSSDAAEKLRSVIDAVARSEIDVVIEGAVGTGKSYAARLVHDLSPRAGRPFVTVDGGILAHEDAELLLFGRDPAAGLSRTGLLERANGGTLFLDELALVSDQMHSRLLAVLDSRSILPIGADRPRRLNLRIVLARNPALDSGPGGGRVPLEQRLGAVRIALPALTERRADIVELFRHFVRLHQDELGTPARAIGEAELHHIQTHDWPGNLRELSGFARAFVLGLSDLGPQLAPGTAQRSLQQIVADFERSVLEDALRCARGDMTSVPGALQTPRKTIYDKLARYGLKPAAFR
ncbi:MAG: sigma-54-dependent Fis family transcriptional regulator [Novosphingobium sp.]|uniref:sigma-54-dependent transcriptional regulator n=1 Tax=Novosphingobium sp. TaxID=1874826 RepID=UPI0026113E98|nr:sigma-54 dependent transcriptional regulator [Novosphingobium sp.]MCP5386275.1 sigma-54-dependent Fis family transcriptional regulator [Novosphingobium sp.]